MQTHLVSKLMHQNLAVIIWQFNYGKNSFIVLVPGTTTTNVTTMLGPSRGQVLTFSLTWLTYCLTYFLRKPIAFLKIMLESEFHLAKSDLGWIDVSLLMPYALVQVFGSAR